MAEKKEELKPLTIYEKLFMVQQHLVAPKNQYNNFGKYKYRSCEDIFEGLKPVLSTVRAIVKVSDDICMIGERFYIKATAEFIDAETGEIISNTAYARESDSKAGMDLSQITGSASSYARKYALNGLFSIDDTKDADSMDNSEKTAEKGSNKATASQEEKKEEQPQPKLINPEQVTILMNMLTRKGFSAQNTYKEGINNITVERYEKDMARLSKLPDKQKE